jgi:hypothetical protein
MLCLHYLGENTRGFIRMFCLHYLGENTRGFIRMLTYRTTQEKHRIVYDVPLDFLFVAASFWVRPILNTRLNEPISLLLSCLNPGTIDKPNNSMFFLCSSVCKHSNKANSLVLVFYNFHVWNKYSHNLSVDYLIDLIKVYTNLIFNMRQVQPETFPKNSISLVFSPK